MTEDSFFGYSDFVGEPFETVEMPTPLLSLNERQNLRRKYEASIIRLGKKFWQAIDHNTSSDELCIIEMMDARILGNGDFELRRMKPNTPEYEQEAARQRVLKWKCCITCWRVVKPDAPGNAIRIIRFYGKSASDILAECKRLETLNKKGARKMWMDVQRNLWVPIPAGEYERRQRDRCFFGDELWDDDEGKPKDDLSV